MITLFMALAVAATTAYDCPIAAGSVLPELSGRWHVLMIGNLDRPRAACW